jgi:predicted membrane protein
VKSENCVRKVLFLLKTEDLNTNIFLFGFTMKHKNFWTFFLFGALIGLIVGFMKSEIALWLVVGSVLGLLVASFFESKYAKVEPEKSMLIGFFFLVPIMFFSDYLMGSFWYDVFGILAVIGSFTVIVNSVKILRKRKKNAGEV